MTTGRRIHMNPNYLISVKRTLAQTAAAWVVAQAARFGVDLPGDAISDLVFALLFGLYYVVYRSLEQHFPEALKFLGAATQPVYEPADLMNDTGEHDGDK
jgi:hypothetical protein